MGHPVNVQIDDFGVWAVELDVGVEFDPKTGISTAVIGHTSPGSGVCSGSGDRLVDYLAIIRDTIAIKYRPVFIYFDIKDGFDGDDWTDLDPLDKCDDHAQKYGIAIRAMEQVFQQNFIQLHEYVDEHNGNYPTVHEMTGKAILYFPTPEFALDNPDAICSGRPPFKGTLIGGFFDSCTSREGIQVTPGNVLRVDQYQADWTFEYGVPSNPLVVDSTANSSSFAPAANGDLWSCDNGDVSHGEVVAEQGTIRFPYTTIGRALTRAEGTTPNGFREERRSGFGWTVLIKPGNYAESLRIDIPLTLAKDDRFDGTVMIAGQPGRMVRSIWITFRTNDDGKDPDTGLLVEVRSNDRVLARFQQRRDKKYGEVFTHTEQLQLFGPVFETEMSGAVLALDITPNGNDTWRFDWELNGTWSDGLPFSDGQVGIDLDEDKRHFEKVLGI